MEWPLEDRPLSLELCGASLVLACLALARLSLSSSFVGSVFPESSVEARPVAGQKFSALLCILLICNNCGGVERFMMDSPPIGT
ncbi:MAG TPA: hypothetical protein DIV79_09730 [Opitutae bacterium]|nr:hypothetical protein [Opitutaceae bacterium]HCR30282.1 hypothetical protein [Opitutae bacterium]